MRDREIADRLEIDDLLTRYAVAVDTKDWALYESCFTPDAEIDYTSAGGIRGSLGEVRRWLEEVMQLFPMTQHVVANRVIRVDGDRATCRSYFYNPMGMDDGRDGMKLFIDGGYYEDELVRTKDGWKISRRVERSAYSTRLHRLVGPEEWGSGD